jgi:hypothetical protein
MYPKKSAIWPVPSFPETGHKNQKTFLFGKKLSFLNQARWQPNLSGASLKPEYNQLHLG